MLPLQMLQKLYYELDHYKSYQLHSTQHTYDGSDFHGADYKKHLIDYSVLWWWWWWCTPLRRWQYCNTEHKTKVLYMAFTFFLLSFLLVSCI